MKGPVKATFIKLRYNSRTVCEVAGVASFALVGAALIPIALDRVLTTVESFFGIMGNGSCLVFCL